MDRRTWMQLIGVLAAARPGFSQTQPPATTTPQPPADGRGGGRGGRGPQRPLRVTREQVQAALKLLGLEFQDAEIDMMLRDVDNDARQLRSRPQDRRPLRHRAVFRIPSGPARPHAHQRPAAIRHHHSQSQHRQSAPRTWKNSRSCRSPNWRRWCARAPSRPPPSPRCTWSG